MNKILGTHDNFMLECLLFFSINFNLLLDPRQEKDNTKLKECITEKSRSVLQEMVPFF